jgi:hypothetical protein
MSLWIERRGVSRNVGRSEHVRRSRVVSLMVCALLALGCGPFHKYVLPTGDGGSGYSPHALQGRITAVEADRFTIAGDGGEMTMIPIGPETRFYKLSGGVVLRPELTVGHRVRIWFASPITSAGTAAVVLLASLDPADDWPK